MADRDARDILFERRGGAGVVTLNRPAALNALTRSMIGELRATLEHWRNEPAITRVIVTAAPGRAFCAGGDLREIYDLGRAGRQDDALVFFREEYALNAAIKHYPKPYIALIDGIVMGGGVGISVHGTHRVASEKLLFAMPEVGIGFFPDVGATWFLPRLPAEIGTYCALTGDRLRSADALGAAVATHLVPAARFAELREALCSEVPVDSVLARFAQRPADGPVLTRRAAIKRLFASAAVEDILTQLDDEAAGQGTDAKWASHTASLIREKAPLSLKLALAQMRRGQLWSFEDCMRAEFRIVSRVLHGHDFYEGVRALIVDKDNRPRWRPDQLADVSAAEIERYFGPIAKEWTAP
jgi:enoyl-CoA hydratase